MSLQGNTSVIGWHKNGGDVDEGIFLLSVGPRELGVVIDATAGDFI